MTGKNISIFLFLCLILLSPFYLLEAQTPQPSIDVSVSGFIGDPPPPPDPDDPEKPVISKSPTTIIEHPFPAEVNLSGITSPNSLVVIKINDSVAGTTVSDSAGVFQRSFKSLVGGKYNFGIYSRDSLGRLSSTFQFSTSILAGRTVDVSGIHLSPTISAFPNTLESGDMLYIFGSGSPGSIVRTLLIPGREVRISEILETEVRDTGWWFNIVNTEEYGSGRLYIASFAVSPLGRYSTLSHAVNVFISIEGGALGDAEQLGQTPAPDSVDHDALARLFEELSETDTTDDRQAFEPPELFIPPSPDEAPYEIVFPEDLPIEKEEEKDQEDRTLVILALFVFLSLLALVLLLRLFVKK